MAEEIDECISMNSACWTQQSNKSTHNGRGNRWVHREFSILCAWLVPPVGLHPLHWAMCLVFFQRTTSAIKMASKYGVFFIIFFCMWPCHPHGQYGANTWAMAASSGYKWSPWLPASGNISGIAPAHQCGYWTGSNWGAFICHHWFQGRPNHM